MLCQLGYMFGCHFLMYCKSPKYMMVLIERKNNIVTLPFSSTASTLAPFASSSCTTTVKPFLAATCRGLKKKDENMDVLTGKSIFYNLYFYIKNSNPHSNPPTRPLHSIAQSSTRQNTDVIQVIHTSVRRR